MTQTTTLIIGHTGKTGARVQAELEKQGIHTLGVSRSSKPHFDWNDPDSWPQVLEGIHSAYITFQPDLAVPRAESTIRAFVKMAREKGVKHLVMLSGRGEAGAQRAEQVLMKSGMTWNVVRASWFAQNFSEGFMIEGILNGHLALPAGPVPEPFIDIDDIAEVAVAALTRPELHNRIFEVSGPRAITFVEAVLCIAKVLDREIAYSAITIEAFLNEIRSLGEGEEMQWLMHELFTEVLDGRNTPVANGVQEALGRPATDFREYVRKTAASGVWDA